MKIQDLMDFEPQLPGYEIADTEPCLRSLIYKYYAEHFSHFVATQFTETYIAKLEEAYKE